MVHASQVIIFFSFVNIITLSIVRVHLIILQQTGWLNRQCRYIIRTYCTANRSRKQGLYVFLSKYRCTEHTSTGFSPFELMFNRESKTKPDTTDKTSDM